MTLFIPPVEVRAMADVKLFKRLQKQMRSYSNSDSVR